MLLQLLDLVRWESLSVAVGRIAFHIANRAHAWNHGRNGRMTQNIAQRDFWKFINGLSQIRENILDVFIHFLLAMTLEVAATKVLCIEVALGGDGACQTTFIKGNTHNHPDIVAL